MRRRAQIPRQPDLRSTATITPTTTDLQNTQLKMAEHERKSELGLAIICMSVLPSVPKKVTY